MNHETELLNSELTPETKRSTTEDGRETLEMSALTAVMGVAAFSDKGKEFILNTDPDILTEFLSEYTCVRIIY